MTSLVASRTSSETAAGGMLLIAGVVLAAITEAIASTALSLGRADIIGDTYATSDEFAWLDMTYTAVKLAGFTAAPWLIGRFSSRSLVLLSTLSMGAACALAAFTRDLHVLVALRSVQGLTGGALLVAGQTLLFTACPRARQPIIQALFAMGAVVVPATLAPALHGWLLDTQSWTWIFFANAPIALTAVGLLLIADTDAVVAMPQKAFDWIGFTLLTASLACLTYVFSQGSRWDWLEEPRIDWLTLGGVCCLLVLAAWVRRARHRSLLEFRAFLSDDFAFAFAVSFVAGAALTGSTYLIQSFSLSVLAFTPTEAGRLLIPGGAAFLGSMCLATLLFQRQRISPIATVPFGILSIMAAMWMLSGSTSQSGPDDMLPAILLRGFGLGFLFLSITLVAFSKLPNGSIASGIALFNTGRQFGGLMGVAALQTLIDHRGAGNQAVLAAYVNSGAPAVAERMAINANMLLERGMDVATANQTASLLLGRAVAGQATVNAFNTAFSAVSLLFLIAVPLLVGIKLGVSRAGNLRRARVAAAVIPCALLGACVAAPEHARPPLAVSELWILPADTAQVDNQWWHKLNDATLNELVDTAVAHNKDLDEATARLREARANRDAVAGRQAPQIGSSATFTENRLSSNGQLPVGKIPALDPQFPIYDIGFDASWELDLGGGIRSAAESAGARVRAAEEARHGVTLQVIAEVVRTYVELRSAQSLRASALEDAEAQSKIAQIVADRLRVGSASHFDLTRAQAQARSTASAIPAFDADAVAAAFRLAVLMGEPPEARFSALSAPRPLPEAALEITVGLRPDLLRRRPDVRQAERELAAATAEVGVATADLYPRLSLIGAIGQQARSPGDLVAGDSLRFQVGPSFRWPIFSAGRIRALIRVANARADAAASRYERAVLVALADSETAINRFAAAIQTTTERGHARDDAHEALQLAGLRFKAGEDDLTVLLQAQSAYSAAERLSLQARTAQLQQLAALYKALGGGWESSETALTSNP